jgi:hypothetical protein
MMVGNTVAFFYAGESSSKVRAPKMLDNLPTRSREIILMNMRLSASLTLRILRSLYPGANLDVAGVGFTMTCSDGEALMLVEDSDVMMGHIVDMLGIDMSFG